MKRRSLLAGAGVLAAAPLIDVPAAHATDHRKVMTGAMVLADDDWRALAGQKVGVISNPTGILPDLTHIVDTMHASGKVDIVAVFGPEHGFRGTAQAGESEGRPRRPAHRASWSTTRTAPTRTKLADLYTKSGVETVVFDIQDVGARFYTYIWTMYEAMLAAVAHRRALRRPGPAEPGRRERARPDAEARLTPPASARSRSSSSTA